MDRLILEDLVKSKEIIYNYELDAFRNKYGHAPQYPGASSYITHTGYPPEYKPEQYKNGSLAIAASELDKAEQKLRELDRKAHVDKVLSGISEDITAEEIIEYFGIEYDKDDEEITWDSKYEEYSDY